MVSDRNIRKAGVVAVFVGVAAVIWFTQRILLLVFAGVLVALILSSLANLLRRVLPVGHKVSLLIVLMALAGLVAGLFIFAVPRVSDQFGELTEQVPKRFSELRERIEQNSTIQRIEKNLPNISDVMPTGGAKTLTRFFSSTFEAISSLFFILFTALFTAFNPKIYREIVIKMVTPRLREDARQIIARITCTLRYWLLGQFVSMTVVGVTTGVAMGIVGIPFAAALGIMAGIAEFIPIVGPVLISIPAILLALSEGTDKVLVVVGIFLAIQFFESNLLQPIVQRHAIDLPPTITIIALLIFGSAFGLLGMFVAAPLTAMVLVLIDELYLRRYLKTKDRLLE